MITPLEELAWIITNGLPRSEISIPTWEIQEPSSKNTRSLFWEFRCYTFREYSYWSTALIGTMSLLATSSFLARTTSKNRFQTRTVSLLFMLAVANFLFILFFSFYPFLLRNLWNISFGIVFIFPAVFIIQFVKEKTKKIDQADFCLTPMTSILFEIVLPFKLPCSFIYNVLTACFLLLIVLLLT